MTVKDLTEREQYKSTHELARLLLAKPDTNAFVWYDDSGCGCGEGKWLPVLEIVDIDEGQQKGIGIT